MRNSNGQNKRSNNAAQKVRNHVWGSARHRNYWMGVWLVVIAASCIGCSHLKTMGATSGVVAATGLLTGGAVLPTAIAGGVTAGTVSALTAEPKIQAAEITAETVVSEAPDNLFSVFQKLIELSGIGLILAFVIVPLLAGWLIPGPTKLNRSEKK